MKNKKLKFWTFAVLVLLVIAGNYHYGWSDYLKEGGLAALEALVQENLCQAVLLYIVLTVVGCVVLALPGVTFAIVAGLLFGPVVGTLSCLVGASLGAILAFLVGRFFLKDTIRPLAMKNAYIKKWLFDESGQNQLFVLMVTRLLPIFPYNLQNFAYGVTDIPFLTYSLGTIIFMLPGTAMYTLGAVGLVNSENRFLYFGMAAVLAVVVTGISAFLKKRYVKVEDVVVDETASETLKAVVHETASETLKAVADETASEMEEAVAGELPEPSCTNCGLCTEACSFLAKYKLTLADREALDKLSYHCFLCGACGQACPEGIDGSPLILAMRQKQVSKNHGKPGESGYGPLLLEKKKYLFQNYSRASGKSVLFPGCNFPSLYPETMKKLTELMKEAGIGVAYDCCGKPVYELGLKEETDQIIAGIEEKLKSRGIEEVILLCPNCYAFLKDRIQVKTVSVYEKLAELGILEEGAFDNPSWKVFRPCPDRYSGILWKEIEKLCRNPLTPIEGVQCCGLGGCTMGKEPELAAGFADEVRKQVKHADEVRKQANSADDVMKQANYQEGLYVYCASCAGALSRQGIKDVHHILSDLLQVKEEPDVGHSFINRLKTKFIR